MSKKPPRKDAPNFTLYQLVIDCIIASLKAGVIPWEKPWKVSQYTGGPFPRNFSTGRPCRGINIMLLWSSCCSSPFWLTFNQAKELNGSVRKGEKGTQIVFYKQLRSCKAKDENSAEDENHRPCFVLTYHTVFNVDQCDGFNVPQIEKPTTTPNAVERDEVCEAIVTEWTTGPTLHLNKEVESRCDAVV